MEVKPVLDDLEVVESTLAKESTDDHQDPLRHIRMAVDLPHEILMNFALSPR